MEIKLGLQEFIKEFSTPGRFKKAFKRWPSLQLAILLVQQSFCVLPSLSNPKQKQKQFEFKYSHHTKSAKCNKFIINRLSAAVIEGAILKSKVVRRSG